MTFDELQKTWQSQESSFRLTIDSDMLIREVKRNKEAFESCVFWRDFREVAVAVVMVGVFLHGAFNRAENMWIVGSYVILAMTCLYVAAFFIVDHHLQRKKEPRHTDPLLACIESSLIQVNHQIGLLKNVFWWYLLPPGAGIALFLFVVNWHLFKVLSAKLVLSECLVVTLIVVLVFWGVYLLNRRAVRKDLMPRKVELESLLKTLTNNRAAT